MQRHQILVVDDDEDVRESLMDFLQDNGYDPVGAGTGREALDKLGAADMRPCIIILDLMMPIMDGKTFREEQLRNPALAGIPVIIMSAMRDSAETAENLDVPSHFPKPLNLSALLQVVQAHCAPV
jgi:DNA-binding response OmpR family regulator